MAPVLEMEEADYFRWIGKLPPGRGRRKLEGLAKWGELVITREHVGSLESALSEAAPRFLAEETQWAEALRFHLHTIMQEPALYLVVRRR